MAHGRIDIHGHLLPNIDDGCPTVEDSVQCAKILVEAGYTHAFCTPHFWPGLPKNTIPNIHQHVVDLQKEYDRRQIPLRLFPGGEINLVSFWPSLKAGERSQVVTYGLGGKYVLFDFWAGAMEECADCLSQAIEYLQSLGLTLILGHPERIEAINRDAANVKWFADRGVLFQMNTWCLTEPPESPIYKMAERLLKDNRYFALGTDTHNAAGLPNRIRGLEIARELVGEEMVNRLTITNPRKLLPDSE